MPTRRGPFQEQLVIVMVGLPARGKTYIASKLGRYLRWLGYHTRVFNIGQYRREQLGAHQPATFYDPGNASAHEQRREMAQAALDDMLDWFRVGGEIGIYDGTNSTQERRRRLSKACHDAGLKVLFLESICENDERIEANLRATKLDSDDYAGVDPATAAADFHARIGFYRSAYEPISDGEVSYIKFIDVGRRIVVNRIEGYLAGKVVFFLSNTHLEPRRIWLTRHGESAFNPEQRVGGDPPLSERGARYAKALAPFLATRCGTNSQPVVMTSTLARTVETAGALDWPSMAWKLLDEIDAGICDGLTYAQIEERMPNEFAARQADKFNYRYPRGESYRDVIARLEPVIIEIERQRRPVVVVAHQAVLRALYAYLGDHPPAGCPHLLIPLHTVSELTPGPAGFSEQRFDLDTTMKSS